MIDGVEWTRPDAAALLVLPVVLLLLGSRRGRPRELATGTLALWSELELDPGRAGERRRPLPPAWLWCLAAGLWALTAALAAPLQRDPVEPALWTVVVEPGPSLALPWIGPEGEADGTRLERALAEARAWLEERGVEGDAVRWRLGALELARGARPPLELLTPSALHRAAPSDLASLDRPGALWLVARRPDPAPRAASWIATGGGLVPGPVAPAAGADGEPLGFVFDGVGTVTGGPGGDRVRLGPGLPRPIVEGVRAWARSRGLRVVEAATAETAEGATWLTVEAFEARSEAARAGVGAAGRDGWTTQLGAPLEDASAGRAGPEARTWLAVQGNSLVLWEPGRVHVAALDWSFPDGPAVAFALSLGGLLDAAACPPPGRAPVAARLDQGPAGTSEGQPPAATVGAPRSLASAPAFAGSLLLVAAAVLFGRRRGQGA